MLGQAPYYHRTIRKIVVAFGSVFNNIQMVQRDNSTQAEIKRITVPLQYAGKENYLTRLLDNPGLAKPVEITLPRMSFEITGYNYDASRKLVSTQQTTILNPGGGASSIYSPVPWNIDFELSLYVRNVEDGLQVIEQILPFFSPDFTVTINYVPELGISRNMPIILNNVQNSVQYEGDSESEERIIIWTLGFTAQALLYGPTQTGNVITSTNTNIFINTTLGSVGGIASEITLTLANAGLGEFQLGETVYQGQNLPDSTITGTVVSFSANTKQLVVTDVNGFFEAGANVIGSLSSASWGVAQTSPDVKVVTINTVPDPLNATANSDYGFTTTITEYGA